ncbi:MAG: hypothetical protein DRQ55_14085 [Planctomycetota bacterium]|nr:MAG: hypothetical protein DRQ55_14085 [Planctomycetota bacterium]
MSRSRASSLARLRSIVVATALPLVLAACGEPDPGRGPALGSTGRSAPAGVVLVVIDTLRADHLGAYGSTAGLTPNLDALAARSTVFEQCIAASSWTRSSMAALFASEYPTTLGVLGTTDVLPDAVTTLAEALSATGVQTLGATANRNAGARWGFSQGFDTFVSNMPRVSYPDDFGMVPAEALTAEGLRLLDARDAARPFLLFLHYTDPHDPYFAHPEFMPGPEPEGGFDGSRRDLRRMDAAGTAALTEQDKQRIRWLYASEVAYGDRWLGALLDGLAERVGDEVLLVVTADHGEGLWDHAERAHGKDLYEEMIRVPLLVRWPASWGLAPGRVPGVVQNLDVAPTVAAAMQLEAPGGWRGVDLFGVASGAAGSVTSGAAGGAASGAASGVDSGAAGGTRPHAYSEMDLNGRDYESLSDGAHKLIRLRAYDGGKWKRRSHRVTVGDSLASLSVRYFGSRAQVDAIAAANPELLAQGVAVDEIELSIGQQLAIPDRAPPSGRGFAWYELESDPGERDDQGDTPGARGSPLHRALSEFARRNRERGYEPSSVNLDDLDQDMLDELRGLGYVGADDDG